MRLEVANHISLVQSMASGDQRAATKLYDACSPILYALALRIVGDSTDAEEVVLAVFMQAWNGAGAYQEERSTVLSWLAMITHTRALDLVRARARRTRAVARAVTVMDDEPIAISGAMVIASDKVEYDERARAVTGALKKLSTAQRTAIELAYFTGLTHTEIANRLGEPLGTVKTRIRLAVQHLRALLSGSILTSVVSESSGRIGWAG